MSAFNWSEDSLSSFSLGQSCQLANAGAAVCPRGSDPFFVVTYYIKWVITSWTYNTSYVI